MSEWCHIYDETELIAFNLYVACKLAAFGI